MTARDNTDYRSEREAALERAQCDPSLPYEPQEGTTFRIPALRRIEQRGPSVRSWNLAHMAVLALLAGVGIGLYFGVIK